MTEDILFDNLYIGHSFEDAQRLAEQTFEVKKKIEQDVQKAEEKAEAEEAEDVQTAFKDDPIGFVRGKVFEFVEVAKIDPVFAAKAMPEVAAGLGFVALFFIGALFSLLFGGSSPTPSAVSLCFIRRLRKVSNTYRSSSSSHPRRPMLPHLMIKQKPSPLPSQRLAKIRRLKIRRLPLPSRSESNFSTDSDTYNTMHLGFDPYFSFIIHTCICTPKIPACCSGYWGSPHRGNRH
jgi:hypothetical protein